MFYPLRKTWKKRSRDSSGKISRKYVHVSTSNDRSRRLSRLFRRYTCTVSHKIAYLFDDNDLNGIDRRVSCHSYLLVDLKKRKENWSCLQNNERNRSLPPLVQPGNEVVSSPGLSQLPVFDSKESAMLAIRCRQLSRITSIFCKYKQVANK